MEFSFDPRETYCVSFQLKVHVNFLVNFIDMMYWNIRLMVTDGRIKMFEEKVS